MNLTAIENWETKANKVKRKIQKEVTKKSTVQWLAENVKARTIETDKTLQFLMTLIETGNDEFFKNNVFALGKNFRLTERRRQFPNLMNSKEMRRSFCRLLP